MTDQGKLEQFKELLRRAQKHLLAHAKWYGQHDQEWRRLGLPPAGDVRLAEDIDEALS